MKNLITENTHELIKQLAKREEINPDKIIEIISLSFQEAYQANSGRKSNEIEFFFDPIKEEFIAYEIYKVVDEIKNSNNEIAKEDPRLSDCAKLAEGNAYFRIDLKNISKFIGYGVRKNIEKHISELRKEKQYQIFSPLKGEIVSGYIQSVQENFCIINLGKGLGYWDKKEWLTEEKNYLGKHLRFIITDVKEKSDLKQIVLSRRGDDFIKKIFESEVPEIKDGNVIIEKVIRIYGLISKVIVSSDNPKIDPIGSCIGKKGIRIRSIMKDVGRERIDLVEWSSNKRNMIFNLMSPVEIISLAKREEDDYIVVIPEHRMSLALYGGGRINQKISEYLGINLHIKSFEQCQEESDIIVWNGNISFNDYEVKKRMIDSNK